MDNPLLPEGRSARLWGPSIFYVVVGIGFLVTLLVTMNKYPLFPFKMDSAEWASAWLLATIGDYYATAFCLCGIVFATEGFLSGGMWSLGILLLGSWVSCAYMVYRCFVHRSLVLSSNKKPD
mmetsp:Transcript_57199/g.113680  ORF Transcript_57199/g.113680 Transcript_57199/m.113680 type:complete len:122 (-) Transcript_57199:200-565(-)